MANKNHYEGIVTVQRHIIEQQKLHPEATGAFTGVLDGIVLATKIIESQVRRAGLVDIIGAVGEVNVQGEIVQKLDRFANQAIIRSLGYRTSVGIIASEEDNEPRIIHPRTADARYIVLFDPLDGSSNIDVNISVGTIFSVLRIKDPDWDKDPVKALLQKGIEQQAAGYVIYGSSTLLAYTTGHGVHTFTLDPDIGAYVLREENVRMPENGKTYSVNEAYSGTFADGYRRYLEWTKQEKYSLRYIGTLVADFHRTLLRGGVFLYPPTKKDPSGKLRMLYEASPMAFLAEQAGGMATDGKVRILEKQPTKLHDRTPLIVGGRDEVQRVMNFVRE